MYRQSQNCLQLVWTSYVLHACTGWIFPINISCMSHDKQYRRGEDICQRNFNVSYIASVPR